MDLGWSELLVIGVVALIVLGEDLPSAFRTLGRFTGKIRRMAREFQQAMNDAADESGVKDVAGDLKNMTSPKSMGLDRLNEAADRFDKWDPTKPSEKAKSIGGETAKLAEERAESVRKIHENMEKRGAEKLAADKAAAEAAKVAEAAKAEAPSPKADDAT